MKRIIVLCTVLVVALSGFAQTYIDYNKNGKMDIYEDKSQPIDKRVEDLLNQMTFEEKQGQLLMDLGWQYYERNGKNVSITDYARQMIREKKMGSLWGFYRADPWAGKTIENGLTPEFFAEGANLLQKYMIDSTRLGIPMFLAEECMHGIMQAKSFSCPTGIGQAATWNPIAIQTMATIIGTQASRQGVDICFGPLIDIARDARWSRVEETYGEDAYLTSIMGEAFVKGLLEAGHQRKLLSTLKHFTAYGISEAGHNAGSAHIGLRELHGEILPPFKRAIDAGAKLVMTAYNEIDGIPCTMNPYLLKDVLRKRWNFDGIVISDLHSISGLQSHGVARNLKEAAEKSINAGVDLDLSATDFYKNLADIDSSRVNEAVSRVLYQKFACGLFDNPFVNTNDEDYEDFVMTQLDMLQGLSNESIVLLENKNNILPLDENKNLKIALIGPNADNIYNQLGDYTGPQNTETVVTIGAALKDFVKENNKISYEYAKGCGIKDTSKTGFQEAIKIAKKSDVILLCLGGSSSRYETIEYENTGAAKVNGKSVSDITSGEGFDRSSLELAGVQKDLLKELKKLNKPIILVLINGRPLVLTDVKEDCDAVLECFYTGAMGGVSIVKALFGEFSPSGRLPISFPKSEGQVPCYYNTKRVANRSNYLEGEHKALYPFGYGLSYSKFEYKDFAVSNDGRKVSLTVSNIGNNLAAEVVQIYIRKTTSSYAKNSKDLCAFKKVFLDSGKSEKVDLSIDEDFFKEWNADATEQFLSKGEYEIMLCKDSETIIDSKKITIE